MIPMTTHMPLSVTIRNDHGLPAGSAAVSFVRPMVLALANTASAVLLMAGLYLVKSAAGINLLPGPSPLHDLLYHLVR